jgi:protein tyrosine phosphatase
MFSAGVGRTGVFITLDTALCQAKEDERVDIIGIINNMRHQRMKMVQTLVRKVDTICHGHQPCEIW